MNEEWKFSDPEDTAVFTTIHVMKMNKPILRVIHDEGGEWQFHSDNPVIVPDMMIVTLGQSVQSDPSLQELADLPPGWFAGRSTSDAVWVRSNRSE